MSDINDVQSTLVTLLAQLCYPNGTGQPSAPGMPVKVYAGWPSESQLDDDLRVGTVHVTVYPRPGEEKNTTRYPKDWVELERASTTLAAVIDGQQVTLSGSLPSPFSPVNVSLLVSKQHYVYPVQVSDTLTSIATALATLLAVDFPGTTSAGPVITLAPAARADAARIGVTGTLIRELRRQEKGFQMIVWANTPDARKAVVDAIDPTLADTERLVMPDTYSARLCYHSTNYSDNFQKAKLYRCDLFYSVEFATTQVTTGYEVTQETLAVSSQPSGATAPVGSITVNF
jgi:hypothetical protein